MSGDSAARFAQLFERRTNAIKPGLDRVQNAYVFIDQAARSIPSVLVAGTNGKGTTSAFIWKIFAQRLHRVGLYTSPHLREFCERFVISSKIIDDSRLEEEWARLKKHLPEALYKDLSFFEIATLLCFQLFDREQVDFAVYEVGMGGRWDATNICDPCVSVIVGVDFDHQQYLGTTIEAIIREKAGVMRSGRPVIIGRGGQLGVDDRAKAAMQAEVDRHGAEAIWWGRDFGIEADEIWVAKDRWKIPSTIAHRYPEYLLHNLAVAVAASVHIRASLGHSRMDHIVVEDILSVLKELACVRGRSEAVTVENIPGLELIVDVGHNVDGLLHATKHLVDVETVLFSVMADKDVGPMLDILRSKFANIVLFKNKNERSIRELPERHRDLILFPRLADAWRYLLENADTQRPWLVCGSVAAIGEFFEFMQVVDRVDGHTVARCPFS
jgi:dihydrofolate synthase/folylpolyglutamate synthase